MHTACPPRHASASHIVTIHGGERHATCCQIYLLLQSQSRSTHACLCVYICDIYIYIKIAMISCKMFILKMILKSHFPKTLSPLNYFLKCCFTNNISSQCNKLFLVNIYKYLCHKYSTLIIQPLTNFSPKIKQVEKSKNFELS